MSKFEMWMPWQHGCMCRASAAIYSVVAKPADRGREREKGVMLQTKAACISTLQASSLPGGHGCAVGPMVQIYI